MTTTNNNISYTRFSRNSKGEKTNVLDSKMQTVLVPCGTDGDTRHGLLGEVVTKYPPVGDIYREACIKKTLRPGSAFMVYYEGQVKFILIAIRKSSGDAPSMKYLHTGLAQVRDYAHTWNIAGIATAKIGCNQNNVKYFTWADLAPILYGYLQPIGIPIEIYVGVNDHLYFPQISQHRDLVAQQDTAPMPASVIVVDSNATAVVVHAK